MEYTALQDENAPMNCDMAQSLVRFLVVVRLSYFA